MYLLARPVRLVRVVKHWFASRTVCELHIIRETYDVYTSPRPVQLVRLVRVVKQWLTSRTVCELHIIRDVGCIYKSTTRTTRMGHETMVYESYSL